MSAVEILKTALILSGIFFLCLDFMAYSNKKITESIALGWVCFCVLLIILGIVADTALWDVITLQKECIVIYIIGFFLLFGIFCLSVVVSGLSRKNQELAMHVSLLNQENEMILKKLNELKEEK